MNTTLFFENYLILIVAIFKRARLDARRGDRSARLFLQYFGASVPKRKVSKTA